MIKTAPSDPDSGISDLGWAAQQGAEIGDAKDGIPSWVGQRILVLETELK